MSLGEEVSLLCPLPEVLTISVGGGSALLPAPIPPVTLEEKQTLTKLLAARGATIQELNTIRKALSQLKGGGLAQAAYPAQVREQPWADEARPTCAREMKA